MVEVAICEACGSENVQPGSVWDGGCNKCMD